MHSQVGFVTLEASRFTVAHVRQVQVAFRIGREEEEGATDEQVDQDD